MTYTHKYNDNLTCTVIEQPKGKKGVYVIEVRGKKRRQNKDIFEKEWILNQF